jgi:hypothetical protein
MGARGPKSKKVYTEFGNLKFDLDFFHSKLEEQANGCIEWTGAKHVQGYGMCGGKRIHDDKKIMTVTHRIAMMEKLGRELTHDDFVVHDCGNPLCCNPDHLILGDVNTRGAVMQQHKEAGVTPSGLPYTKRRYKYTAEEVRWIRTSTNVEIAKRYNIDRGLASTIRTNLFKTYQWVK